MRIIFKSLVVILSIAAVVACDNQKIKKIDTSSSKEELAQSELPKLKWLLGQWTNRSDHGLAIEVWQQKNDSTFIGRSYFIVNSDTVSVESIVLKQEGNALYYIPTVSDQNNSQSIKFKLTSISEHKYVFENSTHDFPQIISYTKISSDSMVAKISGEIEGKIQSQEFPFKRGS